MKYQNIFSNCNYPENEESVHENAPKNNACVEIGRGWQLEKLDPGKHRQFNNTGQQNLTFFLVPQTSTDELSSTFYAEFRYVYRIFLSGKVSKIQRNLNVQNSTLRALETSRNFPLKCRGVWLSPVFGIRYIHLQCPVIVCQHTRGWLALVLLFHSHNVFVKSITVFVNDFAEIFWKKSKCDSRMWIFRIILHPIALYEVN